MDLFLCQSLNLQIEFWPFEALEKIKKVVKLRKLEILCNKSGQYLVESVENCTMYIVEFVLFSTIWNRTIPGILLSEIVLSGDHCNKKMTVTLRLELKSIQHIGR